MSILSHYLKGMSMQVYRVHLNGIDPNEANMNGLAVFNQYWLSIREAFAIDRVETAHHASKFGIFDITMDSTRRFRGSWPRINQEGSEEPIGFLFHIVIVAMIPVCTDILIVDSKVILERVSWLDGLLSYAWYAILAAWDL